MIRKENMVAISMAIEMLGGDIATGELHPDLTKRFVTRERLVNKLGGSIRSRQMVAEIVATWIEQYPDEHPLLLKREDRKEKING